MSPKGKKSTKSEEGTTPEISDKSNGQSEPVNTAEAKKEDVDEGFLPLNIFHDEQGFPCLTEEQLNAWNIAHLELELAKTKRALAMTRRELWLAQQAAYRKLTDDCNEASTFQEGRHKAYVEVGKRLTEQLGFDIEGCIINDKSGRITFVDTRDRPIVGGTTPPDHARLRKT